MREYLRQEIPFPEKVEINPLRLTAFAKRSGQELTQKEFQEALLEHGKETNNDFFAMLLDRKPFADRTVFITGGANGIGETIIQTYRMGGATGVVFDIDPNISKKFQLERDGILGVECNITDYDSIPAVIFQACEQVEQYPSIVVLNAGRFPNEQGIRDFDAANFEEINRVNVNGNLNFLSKCLPALQHSAIAGEDANVVAIGTRNRNHTSPRQGAYNSGKETVAQMFRTWAQDQAEVLDYRIRLNGVDPSSVFDHTKLWTPEKIAASANSKGISEDALVTFNLMQAEIGAADVAAAVANLSLPSFRLTTGLWVPVDGGFKSVIDAG